MNRQNLNIDNEKRWLTHRRKKDVNLYTLNNPEVLEEINQLEQEFGAFCLVPLDIPKISSEGFNQWYFENAKPVIKQRSDVATSRSGRSAFLSIDVENPAAVKNTTESIWSKNIITNFSDRWPDLWDQLNEYLPFERIDEFSMWSSTRDIIAHRDETVFIDLPIEFRIVLDDSKEDNLFVSEILPNKTIKQKIQTAAVPVNIETNAFAWNNLRCQHHSVYNMFDPKIIFIFNSVGTIDWKKYRTLIERSVDKYKNRCMISVKQKSDYLDI
jgi:hypothetical protein